MPRNLTEAFAFTTPVTVPLNGEPADRSTEDVALQALTNRTKYIGDRIVSDEWTYPTVKTRKIWIPATKLQIRGTDWVPGVPSAASGANDGLAYAHMTEDVPEGSTIQAVRVLLQPGASRGAGDRMLVRADAVTRNGSSAPSTSVVINDVEDAGGTSVQFVPTGNLGSPYGPLAKATMTLEIKIQAGNTGASQLDVIYGIEVEFTQVGPRF